MTTIEELTALPEGSTIINRERTWQRVADGFQFNSTVVPVNAFSADLDGIAITGATVVTPSVVTPQLGVCYGGGRDGGAHVVVLAVDGDTVTYGRVTPSGVIHVLHDGVMVTETTRDFTYQPATNPSADARLVARVMHSYFTQGRRVESLSARVRELEARAHVDREVLAERLSQYANENGASSVDEIWDIFDEFDLPRPTEEVEVEVTITGHTNISLEPHDGAGYVSDYVSVTGVDDFEVDWEWTGTFEVEVQSGSCACDEVTGDMVNDRLENEDIGCDRWTFQQHNCTNC